MRSDLTKRGLSMMNALLIVVALGLVVLDAGYGVMYYKKVKGCLNEQVTIETGTPVTIDLFVTEDVPGCSFITDVSLIDNMVPGTYGLRVKTLGIARDVILDIVDTTAPVGEPVAQVLFQDDLPLASDVVTGVSDLAPVTIAYVNEMTVPMEGGIYDVPVSLSDPYGNQTIVNVPFDVTADTTAPSLQVPTCIYAFIGESTSYLENVTVSDDFDPEPVVTVDLSQVDPETAGVYQITYTATDAHGNSVSKPSDLILEQMPETSLERSEVYARSADVLYNTVLGGEPVESFSQVEIAFRIFDWAYRNISYTGTSDKSDWTIAAIDGFDTHTGDCYTYYAVCRAMLDVAGIENVRVERYPITTSPHYWNLIKIDGQWYHCDACNFADTSGFVFMQIDSELDHHHEFNAATVPATSNVSVQDRLDFTNFTMNDIEE